MLTKRDVDQLHGNYQIFWEIFWVYAPHPNVCTNDQIPAEDTILAYEEHLKVGLRFPIDPFFVEVFHFHKLSVT